MSMIGKYCIIRGKGFGVFAGTLAAREWDEITLTNARRIWRWGGAPCLSDLAVDGTTNPCGCKFAQPVSEIVLLSAVEVIPCTEKAKESIEGVPIWRV